MACAVIPKLDAVLMSTRLDRGKWHLAQVRFTAAHFRDRTRCQARWFRIGRSRFRRHRRGGLRANGGRQKHRLNADHSPAPSTKFLLQADLSLLVEALANMQEKNAIKLAPRSGQVSVQLFTATDGFGVAVRDNGPDIAPAERQVVLQRIVRSELNHHTTSNGLGLSHAHAPRRV